MGQKIKLSSNIPINLPEKFSETNFGLGFLYPCSSGKGLELKEGNTWFEKVCLSLNKMNAVVGFQNSNLKIPEYIAETISFVEKQIENTSLSIRYNAQTKVNDFINTWAPKINKESFNDQIAKTFVATKSPMVILGERRLNKSLPKTGEVFGLENKVKLIINHEVAHNIDRAREYNRGEYSLKDIMEKHLGSHLDNENTTKFDSKAELEQVKKMINQIWTLSLEHYADVLGILNLRSQLMEGKDFKNDMNSMITALIADRKENLQEHVSALFKKMKDPLKPFISFEDKYKCLNHFTANALTDLKDTLTELGDKKLSIAEREALTVKIVTKADLKYLYSLIKLDDKTADFMDKIFTSESNDQKVLVSCETKKIQFEQKVKELAGEDWVKETDKYINTNKETKGLYTNLAKLLISKTNELQTINQQVINDKIKQVRSSFSHTSNIKYKINH